MNIQWWDERKKVSREWVNEFFLVLETTQRMKNILGFQSLSDGQGILSYHRLLKLRRCHLWLVDSWLGRWFQYSSLVFGHYLKLLKKHGILKLVTLSCQWRSLTVKFLQRVWSSLWFRCQFVNNRFQFRVNLWRFIVEHLLRCEECLQVCDEEEYPWVVKGWKFIVEFGVEELISSLRFFKILTALGQLNVVLALGCVGLKILEGMTLTVVINQFTAALIDFFLQKKARTCWFNDSCTLPDCLTLISGNCAV